MKEKRLRKSTQRGKVLKSRKKDMMGVMAN